MVEKKSSWHFAQFCKNSQRAINWPTLNETRDCSSVSLPRPHVKSSQKMSLKNACTSATNAFTFKLHCVVLQGDVSPSCITNPLCGLHQKRHWRGLRTWPDLIKRTETFSRDFFSFYSTKMVADSAESQNDNSHMMEAANGMHNSLRTNHKVPFADDTVEHHEAAIWSCKLCWRDRNWFSIFLSVFQTENWTCTRLCRFSSLLFQLVAFDLQVDWHEHKTASSVRDLIKTPPTFCCKLFKLLFSLCWIFL